MDISLDKLLAEMVEVGASDLHISSYNPPIARLKGKLTRLKGYGSLGPNLVNNMLTGILTGEQNERLLEDKELDFSYQVPDVARFRGSIFNERGALGGVFRMIPETPQSMETLGVPVVMKELAQKKNGLILVTGPSGSGKTTTLASTIDYINNTRNSHIITIEDPIEYVFKNKTCLIRQREVGAHTHSFHQAIRSVLRQDPDIILVGEMRDRETIETVLTSAETGHLVFSTLHTNSAVDTINRVIDIFPESLQVQIKVQLAATLQGVFSQVLIPHKHRGKGMVLATEVMVITPAIRNMIREGKTHLIRNAMLTGAEYGMQTIEYSLKHLFEQGKISLDNARAHSLDMEYFDQISGLAKKEAPADKRSYSKTEGEEPEDENGHYYKDPLHADASQFSKAYFGSSDEGEF